ncbi:MAG TPA: hypothetical protein VNM15_01695 [Candidatus Binatia bacterium]|nr:hypothetical protein [Candidatus Binatia bacterium]
MRLLTIPRHQLRLFSLIVVLTGGWVGAAQKSPQSVQVTIRTILAGNKADEFDAKLKGMEQQLKPLKYRSYRSLKDEGQVVPWHGTKSFEIPGNRVLTVAPQDFQNNRIALKVRLTERDRPLIDTTVTIPNRGNFILGGPPHEGGTLVLSISAAVQ